MYPAVVNVPGPGMPFWPLLTARQHLNAGSLDDLGDADAEIVLNDHHFAPGNALAVDEQIHLIARQLDRKSTRLNSSHWS